MPHGLSERKAAKRHGKGRSTSWAYGLIQNKNPPVCLHVLGLWLDTVQKSASLSTCSGSIAYSRAKVRQQAFPSWAYGLIQGKSPPGSLQTLGLWLCSGQKYANKPSRLEKKAAWLSPDGPFFALYIILITPAGGFHPSHGTSSSSPSLWPIIMEFRDLVLAR